MNASVGAGQAADYDGTVVAGQVGLWSSDASDNTFDDFTVGDAAGPYEIDGRWFSDRGDVRAWT
jgi:hypothetical protein